MGKRGRKRGATYRRRTNAEIDQARAEEAERSRQLIAKRRDRWLHGNWGVERTEPIPLVHNGIDDDTANIPEQKEEPTPTRNEQYRDPNPEEWKPPDLSQLPIAFRRNVTERLKEVYDCFRRQSRQWNQYTENRFHASQFPWKRLEVEWPEPTLLGRPVSFVDLLLPVFCRVRIFMPDRTMGHLLPDGRMPCKWHGYEGSASCVKRDMVFCPQGPRMILDIDGSIIYCFSSRYVCCIRERQCVPDSNYYFVGHAPEVLAFLPAEVRESFGATVTQKRALSTTLICNIVEQAAHKTSFAAIHSNLVAMQVNRFRRLERQFRSLQASKITRSTIYGGTSREYSILSYTDVTGNSVPSRQYIQGAFVARVLDMLPFYERFLQLLGGKYLRADRSYKVIKFVFTAANAEDSSRGHQTFRAYDSVYTVMNEHGLVIAIYFVRSGANEEIEKILTAIRNRYRTHGYASVQLFFTDDCCHEYPMLGRALPSLLVGDKVETPGSESRSGVQISNLPKQVGLMPLPPTWKPGVITMYDELKVKCDAFLTRVSDSPTKKWFLGLDTEHDTLFETQRRETKPQTLQLSCTEGIFLVVIRLQHTFGALIESIRRGKARWADANILSLVLGHKNVVLSGVGVKGDLTKLYKHWPAELFGSELTSSSSKIFDPNVSGRSAGVISPGRGNGRLKTLMERFFHSTKGDLSYTLWSSPRLTESLIDYAARDAYASAIVSEKVSELCHQHRRPTQEDIAVGKPVRLVGTNSREIGAYGRISKISGGKHLYVTLSAVIRPGMLVIPDDIWRASQPGAQRRTLGEIDGSQEIYWTLERMRLSTEEEITEQVILARKELAARQQQREVATHNPAIGEEAHEELVHTHPQVRSEEGTEELQVELVHHGIALPDGTALADYPAGHILDDSNDADDDIVVVDEHTLNHAEQDDLYKFMRNHVKGDAFHAMKSYKKTLKRKHGVYEAFSGALRDAFFVPDKEALALAQQNLTKELLGDSESKFHNDEEGAEKEAKRRLFCPSSKVLDGIPRTIPEPKLLEQRIARVVQLFANALDPKTGDIFFSRETWKVHMNATIHVRRGCFSDSPQIQYYYTVVQDSGKEVLFSIRGTSQLEGFHHHLRQLFPAFHIAPLFATCLLAVFVHKWNINRMVERNLLPEMFHHDCFNHDIIKDLQFLTHTLSEGLVEGGAIMGFPNPDDFADTGERFYTPIIAGQAYSEDHYTELDVFEENTSALSASMRFSADRDGNYGYPITPVLSCEKKDILSLLSRHSRSRQRGAVSVNQFGSIDFDAATMEWNASCDNEGLKPVLERRKIFPKTAHLLRAFHKENLQRENQRIAMRQVQMIGQGRSAVQHSVIVSRELAQIRKDFQGDVRRGYVPITGQNPPAEFQQPRSGTGSEPLAIPPIEIRDARNNSTVMQAVEERRHLILPQKRARETPLKVRCLRCGNGKVGRHHSGGAATNSKEYCTVPQNERHPCWPLFGGYQEGDSPCRKISSRKMKQIWNETKRREGIDDQETFKGW